MHKTLALVCYIALAAVTAVFLIMTVLQWAGVTGVFSGMPVIAVLSVLVIFLVVSLVMFRPRLRPYHIGFYLLHAGIVLFLLGGLIYTVSGWSVSAAPPNAAGLTDVLQYQLEQAGLGQSINTGFYNQIGNPQSGEVHTFDFGFRVKNFETEYYTDDDGKPTENVKHYEATMEFRTQEGVLEEKSLTVNHPLYYGGYKIYLMSAQVDKIYGYQTVTLLFKRDPVEFLSDAGILLTVAGTFLMCFGKPRDAGLPPAEKKNPKKKTAGRAKAKALKGGGKS